MPTHELLPHAITANTFRKPDDLLRVGDLTDTGEYTKDLWLELKECVVEGRSWLQSKDEEKKPPSQQRQARIERVVIEPNQLPRTLCGIMTVDREAEPHDVVHADGETTEVTGKDRQRRPLFFWVSVPREARKAMMLTERIGQFRAYSSLWRGCIHEYLKPRFRQEVAFKMQSYCPGDIWERFLQEAQTIDAISVHRILDASDEGDGGESRVVNMGSLEVTVKKPPLTGRVRQALAELLKTSEVSPGAVLSTVLDGDLAEHIVDLDVARPKMRYTDKSDKTQTIRFGGDDSPRIGYPLPPGLPMDGRFPDLTAMIKEAIDLEVRLGLRKHDPS